MKIKSFNFIKIHASCFTHIFVLIYQKLLLLLFLYSSFSLMFARLDFPNLIKNTFRNTLIIIAIKNTYCTVAVFIYVVNRYRSRFVHRISLFTRVLQATKPNNNKLYKRTERKLKRFYADYLTFCSWNCVQHTKNMRKRSN